MATSPSRIPARPIGPAERDQHGRPREASKVGTPLRSLALCLVSIAVMIPWPLLGILLTRSSFDRPSEAFLLFGGVTMFPLMILALFGSVPEEVLIALIMLVWLAAAVIPGLWLRRSLRSWWAVVVLLAFVASFSLAQAVMGALLVVGKNV